MDTTPQKFEQWAMIELMGHQRIAGLASEISIAGGAMLRVDVPETKENAPFTRILNTSAIYAINPMTEEMARTYAEGLNVKPIEAYDVRAFMKKMEEKQLALSANSTPAEPEPETPYDPDDAF